MSEKKMLILGAPECEHVCEIADAAKRCDIESLIFNTGEFPQKAQLSFNPDGEFLLNLNGQCIQSSNILSAYWRTYFGPSPRTTGKNYVDILSERDSQSLLESFLQYSKVKWFNGFDAWSMHKCKPLQLGLVAELGVKIPRTRITNNREQAQMFFKQGFDLIFKPVYGGAETEVVQEKFMTDEHLDRVFSASPVTLQEYIHGTNIRTYVIGDHIISAEIKSDAIDFRSDTEHEIKPVNTPAFLQDQAQRICQKLHLRWTAIDWRLDQHGDFYFLEANPSPMFIGFSKKYGLDLAKILVQEMLLGVSTVRDRAISE